MRTKSVKFVEYLKKWKKKDPSWKFSKALQIKLIKNLFKRDWFTKKMFKKYILDYIASVEGQARSRVLEDSRTLLSILKKEKQNVVVNEVTTKQSEIKPAVNDLEKSKGEDDDKVELNDKEIKSRLKKVIKTLS